MNERVAAIVLATLVVVGASVRGEELPLMRRDEIALLVASDRNYSSDEVTELLTMVITIADEELQREEEERLALAELLESCEIAAEVRSRTDRRERWRVRVTWAMVGAVIGAVVAGM